jgi:HPt (histidine-containing phosphotransfer) domain-containing protein
VATDDAAARNAVPEESVVLDLSSLLDAVGGEGALVDEMLDIFKEDAPKLLIDLRDLVRSNDLEGIRSTAHSLKGMVGGLGAKSAFDAVSELERTAVAQDLSRTASGLRWRQNARTTRLAHTWCVQEH